MAAGAATTANATRRASSLTRVSSRLRRHAPEAALAVLEVEDRLVQLAAAEVRPEHARDVELRVRDLPEEEVGDALLAGGADQEIRVRHVGGEQPRRELLLVDLRRVEATVAHV